ncbi:hypothetical protein ACLOJK_006119, partial [Asimina triloba]
TIPRVIYGGVFQTRSVHKQQWPAEEPDATAAGSFGGPREIIESRDNKSSAVGRSDLQTWATLDQIPSPTTLAALHAELSGRPTASLFLPGTNQHLLHHTSLQGFKSFPIEGGVMPIRHPKLEYQSSTSKLFSQPSISFEDIPSALPVWARNHLGSEDSASNIGGLTTHSSNHYGQILCQQQQQQWPLVHPPEPGHTVNLQTSCLIAAPQSSNSFRTQNNNPILINPSSSISNSIEYSMSLVPFNNASLGSFPDRDFKNAAGLGGCSFLELGTSSTSVSSAHLVAETGTWLREHDAVANMNSASRLLGPAITHFCFINSGPANTGGEPLKPTNTIQVGQLFKSKRPQLKSNPNEMDMILPIGRPTQAAQMEEKTFHHGLGDTHLEINAVSPAEGWLEPIEARIQIHPQQRPENGKLKGATWTTAGSASKQLTRREPSELKPQNTGSLTPQGPKQAALNDRRLPSPRRLQQEVVCSSSSIPRRMRKHEITARFWSILVVFSFLYVALAVPLQASKTEQFVECSSSCGNLLNIGYPSASKAINQTVGTLPNHASTPPLRCISMASCLP